MNTPTHRLTGIEVHSVQSTESPWIGDKETWSQAVRCDNGVEVIAPNRFFVPIISDSRLQELERESRRIGEDGR